MKRMTKDEAFRFLSQPSQSKDVQFIANVLFCQAGNRGKRLPALARLVQSGAEVSTVNFVMPYEMIRVNGAAMKLDIALGLES